MVKQKAGASNSVKYAIALITVFLSIPLMQNLLYDRSKSLIRLYILPNRTPMLTEIM